MCDSNDVTGTLGLGPSLDNFKDAPLAQRIFSPVGALTGNPISRSSWGQVGEKLGIKNSKSGPPHAASLRAQIAREQWADYKKRFQPIENVLLGYANNRQEFASKNKEQAVGRVESQYGRAQPQIERRLSSYGLQITPEMQQRIAKRLNYDKGLARVQAANVSNRLSKDQTQAIIGGGLFVGNRAVETQPRVGRG